MKDGIGKPSQGRNNWLKAEAKDCCWQEVKELVLPSYKTCRVAKACMDIIIGLFVTLMTRAHVARRIQDGAFFPIIIFPRLKGHKGG